MLLAAIEERGGAPDIVLPLLDRTVEMRRPGWESALARQLDSNQNMGAAISTALRLPCSEGLKRLAVRKSAQWLSLINTVVIRDEIDDAITRPLVECAGLVCAPRNCISARQRGLRPPTRPNCRLQCSRGGGRSWLDSPSDPMWLPLILQRDHELCADWLRAWFERLRQPGCYEFLDRALAGAIASLPVDVRKALIQDIPAGHEPPDMLWEPVRWLVSDDLDVAVALFDRVGYPRMCTLLR